MSNKIYLSVIVPVYNEVDNLKLLNDKIKEALSPLNKSFEIIYVDDYSNDGSDKVLDELYSQNECVKVIRFKRNFGQTAAMAAGFDSAAGDVIVTLDGDLQNDPADIPAMLEKFNEGYDIVCGWRKNRKDDVIRKIPSKLANMLIRKLTGVYINDYGCTLKVYDAATVKDMHLYGELHRFIPAIAAIDGAEITDMPVNHHPRIFGVSKYNLRRTFKVFLDLLTVVFLRKFITRPLHVFGRIALFVLMSSLAWITICVSDMFFHFLNLNIMSKFDALLIFLVMIFFSLQLLCTGILAEIQIRTYFESQNKRIYSVRKFLSRDKAEIV